MKYKLKVVLTREVELPDGLSLREKVRRMEHTNEELVSPFESEGWDVDIVQSSDKDEEELDDEETDEEE